MLCAVLCPALPQGWIGFVETCAPELIPNISSCKSPHMMVGGWAWQPNGQCGWLLLPLRLIGAGCSHWAGCQGCGPLCGCHLLPPVCG
jgi:hypothetical protein